MFITHIQDATATAVIKGLAVTKYNADISKWDVVFLRNCGHFPKLKIRQVDRRTGKISVLRTYEIVDGDSISITVSSPAEGLPWKYVTDGPFNRNPSHDAQDFRWMLDIQQLSGRKVPRTGETATNSLTISDACFYTSVRPRKIYRKRWVDPHGRPSPPETIGLTGTMFGADFKGESVTVEVSGEDSFRQTLRHSDEFRYEMIFDNTCVDEMQPAPGEADFHFYYRLFDHSQGKVEILPEEDIENIGIGGGGTGETGDDPLDPEDGDDPEPKQKEPPCHAIDDGSD